MAVLTSMVLYVIMPDCFGALCPESLCGGNSGNEIEIFTEERRDVGGAGGNCRGFVDVGAGGGSGGVSYA